MSPSISYPSPDGRYRLDIFPKEVEKSNLIDCPFLFDNQTKDCLFHLNGLWSASNIGWVSNGEFVKMNLRHYADRSVLFDFEVDMVHQYAWLSSSGYGVLLRGGLDGVLEEMQRTTQLRTIFY